MTTESQPNINEPKLERVLVVLSPDLVEPEAPLQSSLITRALALASASGCELEFLNVCHDSSLAPSFFPATDELHQAQEHALDRYATRLAEIVERLNTGDHVISHDTRWDAPLTEAILRKIDEAQPDLVMKQSQAYGYVMGLFNNTDWDLVRGSPTHLWFVTDDGNNEIETLVTAVGADTTDEYDIIAATDYDVFRFANMIADIFGASNHPVHAYQRPKGLGYAAYAPEFGGSAFPVAALESSEQARRRIARKHGRSIQAFAEYFEIDPDQAWLAEGDPSRVIPRAATSLDADLIVMAARNLSRWERLTQSVNAEPVLAKSPCDIVFVKDARDLAIPAAAERPKRGLPATDQERVEIDPGSSLGSPLEIFAESKIGVPPVS